jgi:hypothetical protein
MAYLSVNDADDLARAYVADYLPPASIKRIALEWTSRVTKIEPPIITSHRRQQVLMPARQLVAEVLRAAGASYPEIGSVLDRDHTTMLHLLNRMPTASEVVPYRAIAADLGSRLAAVRRQWANNPVELSRERAARSVSVVAETDAVLRAEAEAARKQVQAIRAAIKRRAVRPAVHVLPREYRAPMDELPTKTLVAPPTAAVMADLRLAMLREAGAIPA